MPVDPTDITISSCGACPFHHITSYGSDICTHPTAKGWPAPHPAPKHLVIWSQKTPPWCPLREQPALVTLQL